MTRESEFVSRAGVKLSHALEAFGLDPGGLRCADFGCNIGGFTDCLLKRGAESVTALDTGYGVLDWTLRNDPRVDVRERTNVLHAEPPSTSVDLVVIDVGWTPQRRVLPVALQWLGGSGRIVTLVKPHYELDPERKRTHLIDGRLEDDIAAAVLQEVVDAAPTVGARVLDQVRSPIRGGKSSRKTGVGNAEFLLLLEPLSDR
ncbi:MAG: SAM-dependent methyltransferase [Planctomycetota bacterium]|nr:SAM-dependent methyltransferase [Planctomycetota bacterium]